ncbi:MAG: molybdenum cofactor guanylyltransferase MobA [Rhodospirillales bacterium]|nr:molybdenum cofactor guanylyltransferase MobA [Rhodospirillales bacterium]MCW8860953.1 molybdenum cofactor guanylyltransferase MobA [Rhodospirillales bacterium]MCW8951268.1 molybdenum cofactor guanylyltransferase MobA [Rhodospirillales bacterium]MCW9039397.1 molybdenum cofactor guanylyltransferase MobA [Rhodospirillales bacterium]
MTDVLGMILAGGLSRRMGGGDKCLRLLGGRPLLSHVIERARPQVAELILNANGDPERFSPFGLEVVSDVIDGFAGPLAGVLTGMEWVATHRPDCRWLATFPGDTPFLPADLIGRLLDAVEREGAQMACAASAGRSHPVVGLWPVALRDDLRKAMVEEDMRKILDWTARYRTVEVEFAAVPLDPFFNVNRPEDFDVAERTVLAVADGVSRE